MAIQRIKCEIVGTAALLMHRFPLEPILAIGKKPKEEQAEIAAYRDPDTGGLYVPGIAFQRCLIQAGVYSKGKGRASLKRTVAACVMITPERASLGVKEYIIDSRAVVISATRGRIIRHRPRLDDWSVTFYIEYDNELLTEMQLRKVVDDGGTRIGLLDFRPLFGRFMVTHWERLLEEQ